MNEFDIINQYFTAQSTTHRSDVTVGIGDDAAIVQPLAQHDLAITTDTLIAGVHFPHATLPFNIGHKALAVNLSDLAAMGATPAWVTMALSLPETDPIWLQAFCNGFFSLAKQYNVQLIGGDLTRGALSITVQAMGFIPKKQAILRSQAKPTDLVYVTGTLGDAGLALRYLQQHVTVPVLYRSPILKNLESPEPRIETGKRLLSLASAAIDISDGLAADLGHVLEQSHVGAVVYLDQLPLSDALLCSLPQEEAIALALSAGDDYELCFTVPVENRSRVESELSLLPYRHTCIGEIRNGAGLELRYQDGRKYHGPISGYQHF